jgi:hypothetical protein
MWIYVQRTGYLYDAAMNLVAVGYAGAGEGRNSTMPR